jgi:FkbM family methyltransferase
MNAWLKQQIQGFLRKRGMKITHDREDRWFPDFDLLGVIVEAVGPGIAALETIVQIGANDGDSSDPLSGIIAQSTARAFLVEPLPDPFARLQKRYANNDRVRTINAALGDRDGEATIWRVAPDNEKLSALSVYTSFDRQVIEKTRVDYKPLGGRVVGEPVRMITAKTMLKELGINSIDLLQVDTEGWDAKVVNWFLDAGMTPAVINYEHVHLNAAEDQALLDRMRSMGYKLARHGLDTTGVLSSGQTVG